MKIKIKRKRILTRPRAATSRVFKLHMSSTNGIDVDRTACVMSDINGNFKQNK